MTGGVNNYVKDGVNGYALIDGSSANDFAEHIANDIHTGILKSMRNGAISLFKEKLSWEAWANGFRKIMNEEYLSDFLIAREHVKQKKDVQLLKRYNEHR